MPGILKIEEQIWKTELLENRVPDYLCETFWTIMTQLDGLEMEVSEI